MKILTISGKNIETNIRYAPEDLLQDFSPSIDGKFRIVYCTTNLINSKRYIGQHTTKNLNSKYSGSGLLLRRAIAKYGEENFSTRFLCFCNSKSELDEAEKFWIAAFESIDSGYNIATGGQGGMLGVNDRIVEGIQRARQEGKVFGFKKGESNIKYWKGKSKETHPMYAHVYTDETIQKMRDNHADFSGANNPNFGKKQKIVICPYCQKSGGEHAMHQWHFDNCKAKSNENK